MRISIIFISKHREKEFVDDEITVTEHIIIILVLIFLNDVDNILMERSKILSKSLIGLYFRYDQ